MSVAMHATTGEASECSEGGIFRSLSPKNTNPALQISCKDASVDTHLPDAFRPKPKISRTPPNSTPANEMKTNIVIKIDNDDITDESKYDFNDEHHNDNNHLYTHDSGTYQSHSSQQIHSPSLSIEYPPGSSVPRIAKRKKFQFKKSHYQRFVGTSSAQKTKEMRKRDRSRSNSVISYQSSDRMSTGCPNDLQILKNELVKQHQLQPELNNDNGNNNDNDFVLKPPQESLPPTPPSDDIISTLSQMMNKTPNKLPHHITTNSAHSIHLKLKKDQKQNKNKNLDDASDE